MAEIMTGMTGLVLGACLFAGMHLLVAGTALRGALIGAIGEKAYQGVFSLLSILGLVWLVYAYGGTQPEPLWSVPVALDPLFGVVILVAFIFLPPG